MSGGTGVFRIDLFEHRRVTVEIEARTEDEARAAAADLLVNDQDGIQDRLLKDGAIISDGAVPHEDDQGYAGGEFVSALIHRYEFGEQGNLTELCGTTVHRSTSDAVVEAKRLMREDVARYAYDRPGEVEILEHEAELESSLRCTESPRCLIPLNEEDNVVFELYRRRVE